MNWLTTVEEYPHGAEGRSADKLTGNWCRGVFEATACVEKLSRYENTGLEPDEILVIKEAIQEFDVRNLKDSFPKLIDSLPAALFKN